MHDPAFPVHDLTRALPQSLRRARGPRRSHARRSDGLLAVASLALLAGCGTLSALARPEGDGGWSTAQRAQVLGDIAVRAGVDLDPAASVSAVPRLGAPGTPAPAHSSGAPATPEEASPPNSPPAPVTDAAPGADAGAQPNRVTLAQRLDARAPPAPLTLAAALRRAATGNRRLAEAQQQLALARQQVYEARGRLFPATTGSARYTWYTDPQTVRASFPGATAPPVAPTITIRDAEVGVVNGTLTLPLDLSGEIRFALAAAQAGYRGEAARLWATTLEQQLVVIDAYYTLLEAERLRDVNLQTIALHRQQLTYAQDRFESGRLTKNQVLVVQVALRNAEQRGLQQELAIDQARWSLNAAIGLPVDAPTEVADIRERPELPPAAEALRLAYQQNPVLHALLEEQQRLEATATALARARLPRFAAGASVDDTTSNLIEPPLMGAGFVGFDWDLGTDTRREARIAQARIAAEQNRTRVERDLRELEQAVRSTHRAAEERLAALATAEVAVGQAEENLRIRSQQFDAGRATSEDVLDAEALLSAERATLATALYQARTRLAELQRLMGVSLETDGR